MHVVSCVAIPFSFFTDRARDVSVAILDSAVVVWSHIHNATPPRNEGDARMRHFPTGQNEYA